MDIFEIEANNKKRNILVIVDHYSDFFEIEELPNMEAATIIKCCKRHFSRYGIPRLVITDNGTPFKNQHFVHFSQEWEFSYATSAPYHHEGNGKAESAVKSAKQIIKKSLENNEDIYKALLLHRNTPNRIGSSPAQRLMGRRTRCGIPFTDKHLDPKIIKNVPERIAYNKAKVKKREDKKSRSLKELEIGQPVFVKLKGENSPWSKGVIQNQQNSRSYVVEVNGTPYRRDRVHVKEAFHHENDGVNQSDSDEVEATQPCVTPQQTADIPKSPRPLRTKKPPVHLKDYLVYK